MNARLKVVESESQAQASPVPVAANVTDLIAHWSVAELVAQTQLLQDQGQQEQASTVYSTWLAHVPADKMRHAVLFNHGALLQALGRMDDAVRTYTECLALAPAFGHAYVNLGLLYEKLGRTDAALQVWSQYLGQRMLKDVPDTELLCTALNHIGRVHENSKHYDLAERALEESLRLNPKQPGVIQHWIHVRQKACQWPVYKDLPGLSHGEMLRATSPLAMLALTDDAQQQLMTAQSFVYRTYETKQEWLYDKRHKPGVRWRVGLVSADLREHAVGFLLPSFLRGTDRERYELIAYDYTQSEKTPLRTELLSMFDQVRDISKLSDRQAAELMAADHIDILIDLHGLSSGARPGIFALHPAPRQVTYIGYIGSTGMPWFDHVIVDRRAMPPELAVHFTEKPLYLSSSFIPLTHEAASDVQRTRAQAKLPEGAFVMAAFGNVYKITPEMFACWMRLLKRIPGSLLWLIDDNAATTRNLKAAAAEQGVPEDRLVFAPRCDPRVFRAQLRLADVYLDTYPYNCGSTSNDVVNAGVPLVSRYGDTLVSRMGLTILTELQRQDLAVDSFEAYEDKVQSLASGLSTKDAPVYVHQTPAPLLQEALERIRRAAV